MGHNRHDAITRGIVCEVYCAGDCFLRGNRRESILNFPERTPSGFNGSPNLLFESSVQICTTKMISTHIFYDFSSRKLRYLR